MVDVVIRNIKLGPKSLKEFLECKGFKEQEAFGISSYMSYDHKNTLVAGISARYIKDIDKLLRVLEEYEKYAKVKVVLNIREYIPYK